MTFLGDIDIHRAQLTYDYVDLATSEFHTAGWLPRTANSCALGWSGSTASRRRHSRSRGARAGDMWLRS